MRKRVEAGAQDVVSRIRTVKGADYAVRSSAHRALIGGGWEGVREKRLAGLAKRRAAGPSPASKDPSTLRPLTIALYVTRYRSSVRQWPQVELLLERVNQIFSPAQITFQLTEPAECNRSVSYAKRCPFGDDIEHENEWLHLAMVPKLPDDLPVLPACGRCALISDKCSERNVAQALASLLGLRPTSEGLMATGHEEDFNQAQIQWMRWQAWLLQGQPVPLPLVTVPLWVYPVITPSTHHTQRTHQDMLDLVERANVVWQQAGVAFELVQWCGLQQQDLEDEQWTQALQPDGEPLQAIADLGPGALHLFLVRETAATWKLFPDPERALILMRDEVWREELPERSLAHALGMALGLTPVVGTDQLMCPYSQGTRLSAVEAARARERGLELTGGALDQTLGELALRSIEATVDPAPTELAMESFRVRLLLVRDAPGASRTNLAEAQDWLERVQQVWTQAAIRLEATLSEVTISESALEAAYPNPKGATSSRKASCAGLQKVPGYEANQLNLFVVHQLPVVGRPGQFQSYTSWSGARLVLVAENVPWHTPDKQLALAIAVGLSLKAGSQGPLSWLLRSRTPGLRLTSEQVAMARAGLRVAGKSAVTVSPPESHLKPASLLPAGLTPPPGALSGALRPGLTGPAPGPKSEGPLRLPIKLRLGLNCGLSEEQAQAQILAPEVWAAHDIRPEIVGCDRLEIPEAALHEACPDPASGRMPFNFGLMRLPGNDALAVNVIVVRQLPLGHTAIFPVTKMVLTDPQSLLSGLTELLGDDPHPAVTRFFPIGLR